MSDMLVSVLIWVLGTIVLGTMGCIAIGVFLRSRANRKRCARETTRRCRCGYELAGLDVARCPECGRVSGFDVTPEALGLTDEHLRRIKAAHDARQLTEDMGRSDVERLLAMGRPRNGGPAAAGPQREGGGTTEATEGRS